MSENDHVSEATKGPRSDTLDQYARLTHLHGRRLPVGPSELPIVLHIPPIFLGDMEEAIFTSEKDGKERNQFIDWDIALQELKKSRLLVGDKESTSSVASLVSAYKVFFGSRSLLEYHTHPGDNWTFSGGDIVVYKAFPRDAYIHAAVSRNGVSFICRTKQSAKIPVSSLFEVISTLIHSSKLNIWDVKEMSEFFKKQGFGYYLYVPKNGVIQKGELSKGIVIEKR